MHTSLLRQPGELPWLGGCVIGGQPQYKAAPQKRRRFVPPSSAHCCCFKRCGPLLYGNCQVPSLLQFVVDSALRSTHLSPLVCAALHLLHVLAYVR